eukprot:SAG22_NODE_39_length_26283_cov_18.486653_4_plen_134_part_00
MSATDANVRVFCRFRPINAREREEMADVGGNLRYHGDQTVEVNGKQFSLDYICPPPANDTPEASALVQEEMYEHAAGPAVEDVLSGYNGTIFAYGQTGSGAWRDGNNVWALCSVRCRDAVALPASRPDPFPAP